MIEFEKLRWEQPEELEIEVGKVLESLEELKSINLEDYSEPYLGETVKGNGFTQGFDRYEMSHKQLKYRFSLAYGCHACKKIILGPPRLEQENSMSFLSGREGLDYYCGNCGELIHEYTSCLS